VERSGPLTDRFRRGDRQAGVAADATVSRDRTTEYGPWVTPVAGTDDRPARSGLSPVAGRPPRTASSDLPRKRIDGEETTMNERLRVVVGIDGSAESRAALRFALEEAAVRGTGLRVVSALLPPMYWPEAYGLSAPPTVEEKKAHLRVGARRMLDEVIAERPTLAAVPVELHEVEGRPADVLVEQSRGADMLVVGHRGRGGVASAVLGSVGLHCVLHAQCPVTVIRPARAQVTEAPDRRTVARTQPIDAVVAPMY
jgi:nucleotide-binding universal stress UspA family protein